MTSVTQHYRILYGSLEADVGSLSNTTSTGIVGFSGGGPVSVRQVPGIPIYVTCELSLYQEQFPSSDGENYELLCRMPLSEDEVHTLLTALGNLSMEATLGHKHTIDVTAISGIGGLAIVSLKHYSSSVIGGKHFAIYEVAAANEA